jgi:hypothetical protein
MSTVIPQYPFDPTGLEASNKVIETQAIQSRGTFDHYFVIPRVAPFFADGLSLRIYPTGTNPNNPAQGRDLVEGVDYNLGYHFADASHTIGKQVYGAISFYDRALEGQLRMELQTLGGDWVLDDATMSELLLNNIYNPRIATWEQVVELPFQFPVVNHVFDINDFVGMAEVEAKLEDIRDAIIQANSGGLQDHIADKNNPHEVTKTQVGLGLVDNYPSATSGEAIGGTANNRFMTPLRTKQAIDAFAVQMANNHIADFSNPHQVTKAQVGLGSVQNNATATQSEAEAGASNTRFMTPLRVRQAIEVFAGAQLDQHIADHDNPHQVTKAQVGLGSVVDIGIATDVAALQGIDDSGVITPRLLNMVISETAIALLTEHAMDSNNPHGVTKAQVGLGEVDNFKTANEAESRDATANDRFMTPLGVRQAINELVGDMSATHVTDYSNPHNVTAAQVGAFTTAEIEAILLNFMMVGDTAENTARVYGMTQAEFETWISQQSVLSAERIGTRTFEDLRDDILAGTAADSNRFAGRTYSQVISEISNTVSSNTGATVVPLYDLVENDIGDMVPPPEHWVQIGEIMAPTAGVIADTTLLITGGRDNEDNLAGQHTMLVELGIALEASGGPVENATMVVHSSVVKHLTPSDQPMVLGYFTAGEGVNAFVRLYLKMTGVHAPIVITEMTSGNFTGLVAEDSPGTTEELLLSEPGPGLTYPPVIEEGSEAIATLIAFSQRTDNPHQVTKAQVGLGNVPNFGTASEPEAIEGIVTDKLMTPANTNAAVSAAIGFLCDELGSVIDAAIPNFQ